MSELSAPTTLTRDAWRAQGGPDYNAAWAWRQRVTAQLHQRPDLLPGMEEHYSAAPWDFINHWVVTYDPRRAGPGVTSYIPLIMFERQEQFVRMLHQALLANASVLVDKSRDMGVTWLCCAFSAWLWRFWPGSAIGWGSRKAELVDKIGDPDSIFEKIRILLRWLPRELLPRGFSVDDVRCVSQMRILNPDTGASIIGEAGDNIGRGGRKLIYLKDESAHYERPELIEAALTTNTNVQVDISTVNGPATVFQRKRDAGRIWTADGEMVHDKANVFIFDHTDHPLKGSDWYAAARARAANDGLGHIFAQEVDRDPSASVIGTIIRAEWVRAAVGAAELLGIRRSGMWGAGLDVADSGPDLNALVVRQGIFIDRAEEWGDRRGDETARMALDAVEHFVPIEVQYDSIGVGASVKAEVGRLEDEKKLPRGIRFVPWSAAASPIDGEGHVVEDDQDSPTNDDFFKNLKAQAWWMLARRFERTYRVLLKEGLLPHVHLDDQERETLRGLRVDYDDLISIDPSLPLLHQLMKELSQAVMTKNSALKLLVDKTPSGQRSPNLADSVVMAFWPADAQRPMVISQDALRRSRSPLQRAAMAHQASRRLYVPGGRIPSFNDY